MRHNAFHRLTFCSAVTFSNLQFSNCTTICFVRFGSEIFETWE